MDVYTDSKVNKGLGIFKDRAYSTDFVFLKKRFSLQCDRWRGKSEEFVKMVTDELKKAMMLRRANSIKGN